MSTNNIQLFCKSLSIQPNSKDCISVLLNEVDTSTLLQYVSFNGQETDKLKEQVRQLRNGIIKLNEICKAEIEEFNIPEINDLINNTNPLQ